MDSLQPLYIFLLPNSLCVIAAAARQGGGAADALQKPLHILHGILRDVASRLALNEAVVWVRHAAKAPPWARLLRVEKSVLFSMGVRSARSPVRLFALKRKGALHRMLCQHVGSVLRWYLEEVGIMCGLQHPADEASLIALAPRCRASYWLDIPVVTPAEYQRLLSDSMGGDIMSVPMQGAVGRLGAAAEAHVPPAVELGISELGQLAVASALKLPDGSPEQQAPLRLAVSLASLDTESVILGAAAANARIQLGEALRTITGSMV